MCFCIVFYISSKYSAFMLWSQEINGLGHGQEASQSLSTNAVLLAGR